MDQFRVVILTPLPEGKRLAWIDLNPDVTALSWTTGVGGYMGLNVGYKMQGMPASVSELKNPIEVPDLATVQVWMPSETGFLCFEGRVQEVDDLAGFHVQKFTASGFGTSQGALGDDWFYVPPVLTGTKNLDDVSRSAIQLLYRMVPAVTDILRVGDRESVVDPGGDYTPRQQGGRYLGQAIDQIVKAGAGGGQEIMLAVYEDRRIQIKIIDPPLDEDGNPLPDYRLTLNSRVSWKRDSSRLIGACAVEYTPPGETKQTTPIAYIARWADLHGGLFRSMLIPTSAFNREQAIDVRDRYLRRYQEPVVTGKITVETNDARIENRFGQPVPFYMYRYGQWIGIGDRQFFITQTNIDASSKKAEVTFTNVPTASQESR